jgi:hypothetical protein
MTAPLTREQFLDIVTSVDATAEIGTRRAGSDGRPHPFVTVRVDGHERSWERPTYRQCFREAIDWLEGVVR